MTTIDNYEAEDNKLVSLDDLNDNKTLWDNDELLNKLSEDMEKLSKLRIPVEVVPTEVIDKAIDDVLKDLNWATYEGFKENIDDIYDASERYYRNVNMNFYREGEVPFSYMSHNKITREFDIWNQRVFINIRNEYYEHEVDGKVRKYNKRKILMSKDFNEKLRTYCKDVLNGEAQFLVYTGTYSSRQKLDMTRVSKKDIDLLKEMYDYDEINADDFVMVKFMKKIPEVYVGA